MENINFADIKIEELENLDELLIFRAFQTPDDNSLIFARKLGEVESVSFSDLNILAANIADALDSKGISKGSKVAVVLEDRELVFAAVYAVWRLGAVVVPFDPRWGPESYAGIMSSAQVDCIVGYNPPEALVVAGGGTGFVALEALVAEPARNLFTTRSQATADGLAIIAYTSGTTGAAKGVMIRHRHLYSAYSIAALHLFGDSPPARFGSVFRIGGLGVLGLNFLLPMRIGCATVVLPELTIANAVDYLSYVSEYKVEFLYLVPTLVQLLSRIGRPVEGLQLDCVTGAAPISEDLHGEFQTRFGARLRNIYGITEASFGVFYGNAISARDGGWDLGPELPEIPVRLKGADDEVIVGPGEGLLEVSGPTLTDGYFNNPVATAEVFTDGWLSTGDIARRDDQGHFRIVGRRKDVVILGGFNRHLDEIDHVLLSHPAVISAGAVGYRGNGLDETLAAMVQVTGSGATEAELLAWCRARVGAAKTPSILIVTSDPLPVNSSGKIVRAQIAELIVRNGSAGRRAAVV